MKLCSISIGGNSCIGVKTDGGIVDITALGFPQHMNEIICNSDILNNIKDALKSNTHTLLNEESVTFLPVTKPKKIICTGVNYKDHAKEMGRTTPEHPVFFCKFGDSLSAHSEPVRLPAWLSDFDYEAELVVIIGSPAYNVSISEAEACIFGYTCGNDLTSRKAQALSSQWLAGKALPGFAPVGPYITTRDSFDPKKPHGIYCDVNGIRVQSGDITDMIYSCYELVSIASRFFPLSPGDMLFTGTPDGVIKGRPVEDRIWLKAGDIINITIEDIGTLTTHLV